MARIGRAHGIRGEVTVTLISDREGRVVPGAEFDTDAPTGTDRSDAVLWVASVRPHGRTLLVRFEGVDDRAAAEALRGTVLYAEADASAEGIWAHQVIGLQVVDLAGTAHGEVVAVQQNPAHDLLVLDDDQLVPAVFIVRVADQVVVDPPEGLLE